MNFESLKQTLPIMGKGMLGIFAARGQNLRDIVLIGNLTSIPQAKEIFDNLNKLFDMNFIIPENAQFATAIGAALLASSR